MWCLEVTIVTTYLIIVAAHGRDYELTFLTCNVDEADTNASAILVFVGEDGTNSEEVTIPGGPHVFNTGSEDTVNATVDFPGPVCSVRIKRTDAGPYGGWKLKRLDVNDGAGNAMFLINDCFMDDQWITQDVETFTRSDNTSGNWGPWRDWGDMKNALQYRRRACDSPKPVCGGLQCPGNSTEIRCAGVIIEKHGEYYNSGIVVMLAVVLSGGSIISVIIICFYVEKGEPSAIISRLQCCKKEHTAVPVEEEIGPKKDNGPNGTNDEGATAHLDQPATAEIKEKAPEQPTAEAGKPEEEVQIEERSSMIKPSTTSA